MRAEVLCLVAALSASILSGCATTRRMEPLPSTFLEGAPLEHSISRVPFEHAWAGQAKVAQPVTAIYVKPVRTDLLSSEE
jgi:hypothetical protein